MKNIFLFYFAVIIYLAFAGCSDSTEPEGSSITVSFSSNSSLAKIAEDSLQIDSVKILVRNLKLNSTGNDSTQVKSGPFIVYLKTDGNINTVAASNIPAGTYDKIKFEVHKLEETAVPPDPEFKDSTDRYSVIIKGIFNNAPFIYKSRKSAKQIIHLSEAVNIEDNTETNFTLIVNPYEWFVKNGNILDPNEQSNRNDIDNLLKDSFKKGFVDNNKDGLED